jgi:hypothetical protein
MPGVSPVWAAVQVAELRCGLENHFPEALAPMPSADSVVRACLSFVTGSMSRADKNLIDVAALHRHALSDTAELDKWLAIRRDIRNTA